MSMDKIINMKINNRVPLTWGYIYKRDTYIVIHILVLYCVLVLEVIESCHSRWRLLFSMLNERLLHGPENFGNVFVGNLSSPNGSDSNGEGSFVVGFI